MILPTPDGGAIYVSADVTSTKLDHTWAELKARFLDLRTARAVGNFGRQRTASLQLRTAADVYLKLCDQLQHTDQ